MQILENPPFCHTSLKQSSFTHFSVQDERVINSKTDLCSVQVDVDLDQSPFFTNNNPDRTINDAQPTGVISSVTARDPDLVGVITYELVGIYPSQSFFTVSSTGDIIMTTSILADARNLNVYR